MRLFYSLPQRVLPLLVFAFFLTGFLKGLETEASAQSHLSSWGAFAPAQVTGSALEERCGEKVLPAKYYSNASFYSLIAGFGLLIAGILMDKKPLKMGLWGLSLVPFAVWLYVHFFIDFEKVKRLTFTYNAAAENTLANIAEAQDRFKSEQDTFLKDLNQLYSHMAGSHGIDECVKVLKIEAAWNYWSAEAQHVSSPEKVRWDSKTGSSLKKG